jgi:hypothetical protein
MSRRGALIPIALVLAGCGGGGGPDTAAQPPPTELTPTNVQTLTVPDTADPDPEPSGKPVFTAGLTATSHSPTAGRPFAFTVTATKGGKAASATAKMRVFVRDELVNTLGWFPFEGRLVKSYTWPKSLKGQQAVLQAEVEGEGGTQRVNWPVEVS